MKKCAFILASLAAIALSVNSALSQDRTNPGFEKLKSLAGQWQGKTSDGESINVSYQIVSGGSVLMETLWQTKEPAMVTLYHLDGDKLMVTHYCSIGNQPRLRAEAPAGDIRNLSFTFFDATNLAKPSDGHMRNLTLTFQDRDHITQAWTWRENGKDMQTTFNLERKK